MNKPVSSALLRSNSTSSEWQSFRHILAIRLDNIGDVIMLSPALRAIQTALPQAEMSLLASPGGSQAAPLLPWVREVIPWQAIWQDIRGANGHTSDQELQLIKELRSRHFDAAFIFTSFSQSPYPPAYACFQAGIPVRIGQSQEFGGGLLTHWITPPPKAGHQVDRNLHLVQSIGIPNDGSQIELQIPEPAQEKADRLLRANGLEPTLPFIVLAPGASAAARRYEPARFAAVIELLAQESELPIVVVGTERERETIQPAVAACERGAGISLVGQTSISELAAMIRRSSLVITNNSAALHIADAFQRPLVATYSGTEYLTQWEPRYSPASLLRCDTDCSPCFLFQCPYHMECLDLSPKDVVNSALSLLGNISASQFPGIESGEQPAFVSKLEMISRGER